MSELVNTPVHFSGAWKNAHLTNPMICAAKIKIPEWELNITKHKICLFSGYLGGDLLSLLANIGEMGLKLSV